MSALHSELLLAVGNFEFGAGTLLSFGVLFIVMVILASIFINIVVKRIVVAEHSTGLLYRNGKLNRKLSPGVYWVWRVFIIWTLKLYDSRIAVLTVKGQDLLSSDNVGLKVSMAISYDIANPELVETSVISFSEMLYSSAQLALRSAVGKRTIEEILEMRDEIGTEIRGQVVAEMEPIGVRIRYTEVKDVKFTGELKHIFNEVVKARKESQAVLERARGETAVLRKLANASDMLKNNPELMSLKMLQIMSQSSGNTYFVGSPGGLTPIGCGHTTSGDPEK